MAVQSDPYRYWEGERENSDYRSRQTQASSLTRQMLRQVEYLRNSNRVNPGPNRNARSRAADTLPQFSHNTCSEDLWGWQKWAEPRENLTKSDVSNNLLEKETEECGES